MLMEACPKTANTTVHTTLGSNVCIFNVFELTVWRVSLSRWCILKNDWHEGLANDPLPRLCYLKPNPAVGRHLAGGRWRLWRNLRVAWSHRWLCDLSNKVAHCACDELEAVRVGALWGNCEVTCRAHLQNFRQGNLLQDPRCRLENKWVKTSPLWLSFIVCGKLYFTYLVIFVWVIVLEEDDALTVQTPVVPLPLRRRRVELKWDK